MVHRIGSPISVRCFKLIKQHKWLFGISRGQPFNAIILDDFCRMSFGFNNRIFSIDTELRIKIGTLTTPIHEYFRIIESRWCCSQVPFTNNRCLISVFLKYFGKGHLFTIKITTVYIFIESIYM